MPSPSSAGDGRRPTASSSARPQPCGVGACANNRGFVVAYLAVLGVGAIAVPLNPSSPTTELERELDMIDARLIIAGPAGVASVEPIDRPKVLPDELDSLLTGEPAPRVDC